jgi:lysophospholipase L1-like esterase
VAREAIAATKPKFVVMMLGLNDRQAIRERVQPSRAAAAANSTTPPPLVPQTPDLAAPPNAADAERGPPDEPASVPEPPSKPGALRTYEFRTEEWAEQYSRRIDATLAALKSGGVPVFWVGLPSIRGPKSTSDMLYLNDLFRTRAEKAGVTYIDVWDGFVDDGGRYMVQGPDFEGQTRRLRVSDGVHFTKAGARKLAHYVEREIRRAMTHGLEPVALPMGEPQPAPNTVAPGAMAARPLAGPAVSLTSLTGAGQDLAGAGNTGPVFGTKSASRVMVNGDAITAPAGRSDDFKWPRRGIAPFGTDPVVATTTDPVIAAEPPPPPPVTAAAEAKPTDAKPARRSTRQSRNRRNSHRER